MKYLYSLVIVFRGVWFVSGDVSPKFDKPRHMRHALSTWYCLLDLKGGHQNNPFSNTLVTLWGNTLGQSCDPTIWGERPHVTHRSSLISRKTKKPPVHLAGSSEWWLQSFENFVHKSVTFNRRIERCKNDAFSILPKFKWRVKKTQKKIWTLWTLWTNWALWVQLP